MVANGEDDIVSQMALGAYAWTGDRDLGWGAGGPENWPASLPYFTPEHSEDQRGFRIFDWYNAIARATVGKELPLIILGAGDPAHEAGNAGKHGRRFVEMAQQAVRLPSEQQPLQGLPANVVACNFWLLASDGQCGWFSESGRPRSVVAHWLAWKQGQGAPAARKAGMALATATVND
jgi:hypothetical protein